MEFSSFFSSTCRDRLSCSILIPGICCLYRRRTRTRRQYLDEKPCFGFLFLELFALSIFPSLFFIWRLSLERIGSLTLCELQKTHYRTFLFRFFASFKNLTSILLLGIFFWLFFIVKSNSELDCNQNYISLELLSSRNELSLFFF